MNDQPTQEIRETTTRTGNTTQTTQQVVTPREEHMRKQNTLARIIRYIAGVLLTLLALRFVLALLGANPENGFADFIYTVSHPFVAPFFNLFNYDLELGRSRFEVFTLFAMVVYGLIAYGLSKLVTINQER